MAFETIVTETRGRVALITLNRPNALNALNATLIGELGNAVAAYDADQRVGCIVITGSEKAFAAGADIKEMQGLGFVEAFQRDYGEALSLDRPGAKADHRRGGRLLPRRRRRARHDVRHHHRRGKRQVRPARDHPRHHAGHGRHPAPAARRGQGQGDGHDPHRPADRRHRGRALRAGLARRADQRPPRGGDPRSPTRSPAFPCPSS